MYTRARHKGERKRQEGRGKVGDTRAKVSRGCEIDVKGKEIKRGLPWGLGFPLFSNSSVQLLLGGAAGDGAKRRKENYLCPMYLRLRGSCAETDVEIIVR